MGLKENLRAERKAAKLTLDSVSEQIGITKATLQRYETGAIANVPAENIEKLAKIYHTTPTQLMGWSSDALTILQDTFQLSLNEQNWDNHFRNRIMSYYDALGADTIETILQKYSILDERGKHTVSTILQMEYDRCKLLKKPSV